MLTLKEELESRGFLHQYTDEKVFEIFEKGGNNFYFWVDLSADSMTIGNFVALMMAIHVMLKGNHCYLLVWGATSTIGNPSGKDNERPILSDQQLSHNQENIRLQFDDLCKNVEIVTGKKLSYSIVNNKDFFKDMNVLEYLREVGRFVTVNWMISKDIVKKRITTPDQWISYAEFSYMLIMGYDYYYLWKHHNVILEVGGSDEWDGILSGLELISKKSSWTAYGITNKLILDSNGKKFGKSEGNAIWLDSKKNSPYICYNYFMNATDEDIERYLKLFCFLDLQEIWAIITEHQKDPSKRYGQQQLAYLATQIVFWTQAAEYANSIRIALFWWENPCEGIEKFEQDQVAALAGAIGSLQFKDSLSLIDVLVDTGLCTSRWDAKKDIQANAICVNETKITDINYTLSEKDFLQNGVSLIRKGKKTYKIVTKA